MPALNQPIFRSNAIKHYMEGREKHEFPRFVSLPITILLWILLALFISATVLAWSERVPTYVTSQGIVIVHSATQPSKEKKPVPVAVTPVSVTWRWEPAMGKWVSVVKTPVPAIATPVPVEEKPVPATAMVVFFFPPTQAKKLYIKEPVRLHVGLSGLQINSQITSIEPSVMSPTALRALFHLENASLPITQPSMVVVVKLDPASATAYAGSTVTADLQVGSQRLISFLPGVGSLFGM